ncbi:MAG: DUF881 domain-containing protein [Candidatus Limnocylindria bacterium]
MAQLSLFVVALVIGMLLIGQLRSQARPIELSSLSAQELSTLIETVSARNRELRAGLADLIEQLRDYERAEVQGESAFELTEEDLGRISAFAGLAGVEGQGIAIQVAGSLDPTAVNDLINELRNLGAEAIAVDDIRITASSVASLGTSAIVIDEVPIGRSFEVRAIGSPDGLYSNMVRPGGIVTLLEQAVAATITIEERERLVIPATERSLAPQVATPVE